MVAQATLFKAIRNGDFVPFLAKNSKLDIQSQVNELTGSLFATDLMDTFKYIHRLTDKMSVNLTPKERLFCRSWRRGLIIIPG